MLISVQTVKEYLNIHDNNKDNLISSLIEYAGMYISNYCNQNIEINNNTFLLNGNNSRFLLLPAYFPIISLYALYYRNDFAESFTELDKTNYDIIKIDKIDYLFTASGFISGLSNYKCIITTGYAEIPADIQNVALELVSIALKESDAGTGIKGGRLGLASSSESLNGISLNTSYRNEIQKHKEILNKYKRIII